MSENKTHLQALATANDRKQKKLKPCQQQLTENKKLKPWKQQMTDNRTKPKALAIAHDTNKTKN